MTTNNNQPPDMLENDLPEDGELTLEELEQIIGGQSGGVDFSLTPFIGGDVKAQAKIDSSYTSFFGALGTSGNESLHRGGTPFNITSAFP